MSRPNELTGHVTAPSPTTPYPAGRWPRQGETRPPKAAPTHLQEHSSAEKFTGKRKAISSALLVKGVSLLPIKSELTLQACKIYTKFTPRGKERPDPTARYQLKKHQRKKRNSSEKLFYIQGTVSPSPCPPSILAAPRKCPWGPTGEGGDGIQAFSLAPLLQPQTTACC